MPGLFTSGRDHRRRYENWLADAWNRAARERHDDAMTLRVTIEAHESRLDVTRSYWFAADGSLDDEDLILVTAAADGTSQALNGEAAAERVVDLIPRHLAELTFFDGERIRPLNREDTGPWLVQALDRLLDLEPIKRARTDLSRLAREKRSLLADDKQRRAHENLESQIDAAVNRLQELDVEREHFREKVLDGRAQLTHLDEQVTASLSGNAALSVAQVEAEVAALTRRREELRIRFGRYLGDWLYLDLVPDLIAETEKAAGEALSRRRLINRRQAGAEAARTFLARLLKDNELQNLLPDADARQRWRERSKQLLPQPTLPDNTKPGESWTEALTEAELEDVIAAADQAMGRSHDEVRDHAIDLQHVEARLDELARLRARLDAASGLEAVLRRRDELSALSIGWQHELERLDGDAADLRQQLKTLKSMLSHLDANLSDSDETAIWLHGAERLGQAFDLYIRERRTAALSILANGVLGRLRPLLRKRGLVTGVAVEPRSFEITLRDAAGHALRLPSAGEQQLASMAFAAAMLDLSTDPLPMFIDTPLARLDGQHRRNLVAKLLPHLGRQIIVLSTDEEIDANLLRLIAPAVAQTYLLAHDDSTGKSRIEVGSYIEVNAAEGASRVGADA